MGSAELIAQLNGLIDQLSECVAADCAVLSTAETLAGALECAVRRVEGLQVRVVDEMDRTGLFGVDGHHSAIAWSGFTCRTSSTVAGRRVRAARMFRDLGATGEAFMAGTVGVEQSAKVATLKRGVTMVKQPRRTAASNAAPTTGGKTPTASEPGATPTATGTPTAPTAPNSPPPPDHSAERRKTRVVSQS